jgi:hypothetical protein
MLISLFSDKKFALSDDPFGGIVISLSFHEREGNPDESKREAVSSQIGFPFFEYFCALESVAITVVSEFSFI